MSFDDGSPLGFDIERVKARLRVTLQNECITFEKLCEEAGVSPTEALRALDIGSDGFPETLHILQQLSWALGRGPDWLPFGVEDAPAFKDSDRVRVQKLFWEFIYKAEVPERLRKPLLSRALAPLAHYSSAASSERFRRRVPRNLKDVAHLYTDLRFEVGDT